MSLGRRRRFAILERDDFTCQYCGRRAPQVALEADYFGAIRRIADLEQWIAERTDNYIAHMVGREADE